MPTSCRCWVRVVAMTEVKQHHQNRDRALLERTETIEEFMARCRKMTPQQFAQLPQGLLQRLTPDQRADIAASLVSATDDPAELGTDAERTRPGLPPSSRESRPIWLRMIAASFGWGTALSLMVIGFFVLPPLLHRGGQIERPLESTHWPRCQRLTPKADGCVYRVSRAISWSDAASLLNMQETYLRTINHAPDSISLTAGQPIVVWRGHGRLIP